MCKNASDLVLLTPSQMQIVDQKASESISIFQLMENAGWAVTHEIIKRYKPCSVLVLCGPGNNGGDGYVVARLLAKAGWLVRVAAIGTPRKGSAVQKAASLWTGGVIDHPDSYIKKADLVIDAIFGAGLSKDLDVQVAELLQKASHIVAIDMPSGIDGATGQVKGYAPHADITITFFRAKPGHYLLPGREYTGILIVKDICIAPDILDFISAEYWLNEPKLWNIPASAIDDYKYSKGVVSIVGGAVMTGAARLSAHAALNIGAGMVHIFALGHQDIYTNSSACFVVDSDSLAQSLQDMRKTVWVCGPGLLPHEVQKTLPLLIAANKQVVADAGVFQSNQIEMLYGVSVITPHIGEFKRVFGEIKEDKVTAVRNAAKQINCVVVLKGVDTIIAAPDGKVAINQHASSQLATAGSGDVLSGVIATLLATGMSAWEAACAGVWLHGDAGLRCDHPWPSAEMIIKYLGKARAGVSIIKNIDN